MKFYEVTNHSASEWKVQASALGEVIEKEFTEPVICQKPNTDSRTLVGDLLPAVHAILDKQYGNGIRFPQHEREIAEALAKTGFAKHNSFTISGKKISDIIGIDDMQEKLIQEKVAERDRVFKKAQEQLKKEQTPLTTDEITEIVGKAIKGESDPLDALTRVARSHELLRKQPVGTADSKPGG